VLAHFAPGQVLQGKLWLILSTMSDAALCAHRVSAFLHVHSLRIASGEEILLARVIADDGRIGLGFSFRLDATEARHMAEWAAGVRQERPRYQPALEHPWEKAWISHRPTEWNLEPGFAQISWLSGA
jgi:hypothetical protein